MDNKSLKEKIDTARKDIKNVANTAKESIQATTSKISNATTSEYNRITTGIKDSKLFQNIGSNINKINYYTKEFAEKNSTISKFVFIIFLFIMFGLLFRLGLYILTLFLMPQKNPVVINGMLEMNKLTKFNVNPNAGDPTPILRSINEHQGMEFTWSFWINLADVQDITSGEHLPKRIFSKGESIDNGKDSWDTLNSPGVYMFRGTNQNMGLNTMCIVFETYEKLTKGSTVPQKPKKIYVENRPLKKWIHVVIRVQSRTIDVYINSILTKRENLKDVIKQNYGDIYVGGNGTKYNFYGASGYISNLRYFNHAIGNNKIQDILHIGPNTKLISDDMTKTIPPYFSLNWYL